MAEIDSIAEEVRRFFEYQAVFCEQLAQGVFMAAQSSVEGQNYLGLSHYVQSHVLACSSLAGLSFLWEALSQPTYPFGGGDTERFICFLHSLKTNPNFARVCTPFLYYALDKKSAAKPDGVEQYFRKELFERWVRRDNDYVQHEVSNDPQQQDVRKLYDECEGNNPQLPDPERLRNPDHTFFTFTYAGLIYKLYRNAFAHQYHPSQHTTKFGRPGEEMRVLQQSGYTVITEVSPGQFIPTTRRFVDERGDPTTRPFLDVPITVLTAAILEAASLVGQLIAQERYLPYGYDKDIEVRTKS